MRHSSYLFPLLFILFFANCRTETLQEKELSPEQKRTHDSISKVQQKRYSDSLKKKNPLLILPPDSSYTGTYIDKYPNNIIKFKGFFRFGERHGQWLCFYPNGSLWSEMNYDKGLRHGPNTTYLENGKIRYTGFYKSDKQDSIWTYYDSLGKVAKKVTFKDDRIVKELSF